MSARFHTVIYRLSVISALVLTLRVVSTLLVLLLTPGLTMLTHAYLESSYNNHQLQRVQNCLVRVVQPTIQSHSLLASLHWPPISQRVTFKLTSLVYSSLHDTSPAYLSSLLHAYTPIRSLRPSSAQHVEPRLRTTFAYWGFRSAGP